MFSFLSSINIYTISLIAIFFIIVVKLSQFFENWIKSMASPDDYYLCVNETVFTVDSLNHEDYDGVILVTYPEDVSRAAPSVLNDAITSAMAIDWGLGSEVAVLPCAEVAGSRLVVSPTGAITPYDDVRCVYEAAKRGMNRAMKAGMRRPIIVLQNTDLFPDTDLVTLLGLLDALYVPLQVRDSGACPKIDKLGIYGDNLDKSVDALMRLAVNLDQARIVARDIAGGDPERMSPPNVEAYVRKAFQDDPLIKITVQDNLTLLEKEYPLLAAVNRAANEIERHRGRVIFINYAPEDTSEVTDTVMMVGKGVTYDTGGVDIKYGGSMAGMSRDKSGAAAVVGFLKACQLLRPKHIKATAALGVVRNSVGENAYVADELITARSGCRVRVGNTDAEGRMVMADLLCLMMEQAKAEKNPHLYTVATLTGHSFRSVGVGYSVVIDNYKAKAEGHDRALQKNGDMMAEPFEISTLRRDDFKAHRGTFEGDDSLQSPNGASTATERGHQKPVGFIVIASGLEGVDLKYSHIEMAPSAGIAPVEPTGSPLMAFAKHYQLWKHIPL